MKKIIFAIFLSIFVFHSHAQSNTATRYTNEIKNFALYGVISGRCQRYLAQAKHSACQRTVASMLKLIDSAMIIPSSSKPQTHFYEPQAFIFIAFKTTLIDLLEKDSTTVYLQDILHKLNSYLTSESREMNLWELTLSHYPSPKVAAKVMAAMFQDTSPSKLHLAYLENSQQNTSEVYKTNHALLDRTINTINMVLDYNPESFQELLYPMGIQKPLNRNIYHFYVPMYLGHALLEKGASMEMAYTAPMLMTLTYEFVTAASDFRYIFSDPLKLDPKGHEWKIKDIFAGHLGAAMAVGKKNVKSLDFLKASFALSTAKTVKAMLAQ